MVAIFKLEDFQCDNETINQRRKAHTWKTFHSIHCHFRERRELVMMLNSSILSIVFVKPAVGTLANASHFRNPPG